MADPNVGEILVQPDELAHRVSELAEQISKDYAENFKQLNRKRDGEFKNAVAQTKQVLSDEQWKKYERILKSRVGPAPLRGLDDADATRAPEEGV